MTTETEKANQAAWDQGRSENVARAKAALAAGQDATYTAQPGDTFASIAGGVYGDDELGDELHAANAGVIGSTASALAPGHVLRIPFRPAAPKKTAPKTDADSDDE